MSFPSILDEDLLFFDIECFRYDSLIVFKDINGNEVAHFWSQSSGNEDSPNGFETVKDLISGKTLIGYNNYHYDDKMLVTMIRGFTQKTLRRVNDALINGQETYMSFDVKAHIGQTLDCFQQIDVSRPSLKVIEGNMGRSILESSVPFDIDRPLTAKERQEVLDYCRYDVDSTIAVFKQRRHSYFEPKAHLVKLLEEKYKEDGLPETCYRWNTTTISGMLLLNKSVKHWTHLRLPDDKWRNVEGIPDTVWHMWEQCEDVDGFDELPDKQKKYALQAFNCEFVFGFGGLHGAPSKPETFHNVKLLDVGSMYPSIIILLKIFGDSTGDYDAIRKMRLEIKHKDKVLSDALKLILNSAYGNLLNEFSVLYNPLASRTVCIYGQMALFDLCRQLDAAGYRIINANTDGVAFYDLDPFHVGSQEPYELVWHRWEQKWGLNLELDEFQTWIQKDVNNYIAIRNDEKQSIKCKGGEANKALSDKFFSNNSARIIQIGTVEAILHKKSPFETVREHLNQPYLFQYILRAGRTYKGVVDKNGNSLQKVNRIFAGKNEEECTKIYKQRQDDGLVNFPDMPERMKIWNGSAHEISDFSRWVDIKHYTDQIRKKALVWGVIV